MSSPRRAAAILLSTLALVVGLGASPAAAIGSSTYQTQIMTGTNKERVKADKAKVTHQTCIDNYARDWARSMAKKQKLVHQSTSKLKTIMSTCKLNRIGENIAVGYPTGTAAVAGWMGSSGHRANILNGSFRKLGIGAYKDGDDRFWTVQIFGTPR